MVFDHCAPFVTAFKLDLICLGVRTAIIKYFRFLPKPPAYRRRHISRAGSRSRRYGFAVELVAALLSEGSNFPMG